MISRFSSLPLDEGLQILIVALLVEHFIVLSYLFVPNFGNSILFLMKTVKFSAMAIAGGSGLKYKKKTG